MTEGSHVVEVEVADAPVRVSCRFTPCRPRSIDAAFLSLVRELLVTLGMEARACDDSPPAAGFPEFAAVRASPRVTWPCRQSLRR